MTHLEILAYADTLTQVELAALISDLLDLQGRQSARLGAEGHGTVTHEVGAVG